MNMHVYKGFGRKFLMEMYQSS